MKQVERGHWTNEAKEYYYAKRAEALGVRERKDNQHTPNSVSSPSQADHAKSLGVRCPTNVGIAPKSAKRYRYAKWHNGSLSRRTR